MGLIRSSAPQQTQRRKTIGAMQLDTLHVLAGRRLKVNVDVVGFGCVRNLFRGFSADIIGNFR